MQKPILLFLSFFIFYFGGFSVLFAQSKTLLDEANSLYAAQKYTEAADIYRKLLSEVSDANDKAKITYNLGMAYRQMNQNNEAKLQFQKVLAINVTNRAIKQGILNTYENYHHNAQFEIAKIQYDTGDYETALKSFRNAGSKFPFKSDCGSCIRDENYKITLFEAATLEQLNRNKEAFAAYFSIAHPRLLEIYAADGRTEKFIEITEKKNEVLINEYIKKYSYTRQQAIYSLRTKIYNDYFKAFELAKSKNSAALFAELKNLATSPQDTYLKDWTAKMLAQNPNEAVSLVTEELKNPKTYPYVFYRTLGFAATPEAIEVLKIQARKSTGWYDAESIAASLMLAGKAGETALAELATKPLGEKMKLAIEKYKTGELQAQNYIELEFAPLKKAELPDEF